MRPPIRRSAALQLRLCRLHALLGELHQAVDGFLDAYTATPLTSHFDAFSKSHILRSSAREGS